MHDYTARPFSMPLTYKDAGVDIDSGNNLVRRIAPLAARTHRPEVRKSVGGFGALFALPLERYQKPLLVSGTDGVGTKLRLAIDHDQLDGVGIDLVAMCVNDILTMGAEPLFFLDYYATGKLVEDQAVRVIAGIAQGCEQAGAALIGGETAEMPGMYADGDLDLAGFCVGIVDEDQVIDGTRAAAGDAVIGLASDGVHSNGLSLARKVMELSQSPAHVMLDGLPVVQNLLRPTRIYVSAVRAVMAEIRVHAMAHITGGGVPENLPRALPETLCAHLRRDAWQEPEIFTWLAATGGIEREEMDRAFNCGIGYMVCVAAADVDRTLALLADHDVKATQIGTLVERVGDEAQVRYV